MTAHGDVDDRGRRYCGHCQAWVSETAWTSAHQSHTTISDGGVPEPSTDLVDTLQDEIVEEFDTDREKIKVEQTVDPVPGRDQKQVSISATWITGGSREGSR